jgi:hypothetical protein
MFEHSASNWFERNPKKTILLFLMGALLFMVYGTEKLLAWKNQGKGFNFALPHRAIHLREYRPFLSLTAYPNLEAGASDSPVPKDYRFRIDPDGFIMPSKRYENPDITLVFLGASTTECSHVQEENRLPYRTAVLLEKEFGIKINSYNAARSGNDSLHSLNVLLNKVLPLNPQIVVMMHNINDLSILLYEKSYWNKKSSRPVIMDINKEITSNYFKVIRDRWIPNLSLALRDFDQKLRSRLEAAPKPEGRTADEFASSRRQKLIIDEAWLRRQFKMNLQTFINICRARSITPVLMTMASRCKENPDQIIAASFKNNSLGYREFKTLFDSFNDMIRQTAAENQVTLVDLAKEIPPEKDYLYDIVHYSDNGSLKAAELISRQLAPLVSRELPISATESAPDSAPALPSQAVK